jgi:hypothetical protein
MSAVRFWIGVASKDHVARGVAGGFCQLGHGKVSALKRMAVDDWLIYYSGKKSLDSEEPYQQFTAIGQIIGAAPYVYEMSTDFKPYRRDIAFQKANDAPIRPMLESLSFIKDVKRWGYAFRFGHFEIQRADFDLIARAMLGEAPAACEITR